MYKERPYAWQLNEKSKGIFKKIRKMVSKIPEGKVATYGDVARALDLKDARLIGRAIHGNKNANIPCHRLVKMDGSLALNYSAGDWKEDRMKLKSEGVEFIDETHVNLEKFQWIPD